RIMPKGATTFCQGITVTLKTIVGPGYTYQWFRNGTPIPGATSAIYEAGITGNYTVSITLGPNNAVSDPVLVTVNPVPVATLSPSGTAVIPNGGSVTLNASSGTGYTYNWYRNDTLITGANSSSYSATVPGSYYVEIFDGCYAISANTILTSSTGTGLDENANSSLSIFPNPSTGKVTIDADFEGELNVYDYLGQSIQTISFTSTPKDFLIEESGIYYFLFDDMAGKKTAKKVIIIR
ncbi:MAG: T9SS type A sorting domain-containing protein, partial [Bacteroidota bacterium]